METLVCELCGREAPSAVYMERHHLVPVSRGGKHKEKIWTCIDCGDQIHQLFTNRQLSEEYDSLEKIRQDPRVQTYIKWIRKQKRFGLCHRNKKRRR